MKPVLDPTGGPPLSKARRWAVLATACLAVLLIGIDGTVLHLAIPSLTEALEPSSTQLLWIADVYGFVLAGLLITMGNLGDLIGRKKLLIIGVVGFGLASLVTAYAPNAESLVAARALLGVAGATIMPSTLSIIRNVFTDPRERTTAIGLWSSVSAGGIAAGPLIGGVLLDHFWWGSVFLMNVPIMVIVLVVAIVTLPESRNPRPGPIDLQSVAYSIVGIVGLIYAIKETAHHGIGQADVVVAGLVGLIALVAFTRRQARLAHPLIDVRLFKIRAFSASVAGDMIAIFAMVGALFFLSLYLQFVLGWSPLQAGLAQLPVAVTSVIGGLIASRLVGRWGRARVVATGLGTASVGLAVLVRLGASDGYPVILTALILIGIGVSISFTVTADTILATAPKERAGAAASIAETAYELGAALGIAILGSMLGGLYRAGLNLPGGVPAPVAAAVQDSIGTATHAAAAVPGAAGQALRDAVNSAYAGAVNGTAIICAVLVAAVAIAALFTLRGVPTVIEEAGMPQNDQDGEYGRGPVVVSLGEPEGPGGHVRSTSRPSK
ncbi:MFS transporter [Sinosporangium siamense]|uniref:MFS transporter n=1 Tax=Sinosporangium siamense TaxID=1367973 RepID=A0A919RP76_9ACTN|nr:MFS transporter [Sinosporangium siamense]GII95634.1 MFS transporter [Sinosporangium siamense]